MTSDFISQQPRPVERIVAGQHTSDGAGVKLVRVLTHNLQRRLDPFLMLDAFGTDNPGDYIGGFPDHPHRGFETVTYMLDGRMRHHDSAGNSGLLSSGEGFQLWLNLPAKDKMIPAWYRDIPTDQIPEAQREGVTVRVIAGSALGVSGAMQRDATAPTYLDIHLAPGAHFDHPLPVAHNAFVYVYRGELAAAGTTVERQRMAIFSNAPGSDGIRVTAGPEGAKAILIAGQPLNEPIAQYGPFVMNTQQELMQAVDDFRAGRLA
jgi:quercetin 2,3-dioxygenase